MKNTLKMKLLNRGTEGEIRLMGRIDSNNAMDVQKALEEQADRFNSIVLDFKDLEYISSAGLRVLRILYTKMKGKGERVVIRNAREDVLSVFRVTGFYRLFTFEDLELSSQVQHSVRKDFKRSFETKTFSWAKIYLVFNLLQMLW